MTTGRSIRAAVLGACIAVMLASTAAQAVAQPMHIRGPLRTELWCDRVVKKVQVWHGIGVHTDRNTCQVATLEFESSIGESVERHFWVTLWSNTCCRYFRATLHTLPGGRFKLTAGWI